MEECTNTVLIRKVLQPRNIRDGSVLQNLQSKSNKGGAGFCFRQSDEVVKTRVGKKDEGKPAKRL